MAKNDAAWLIADGLPLKVKGAPYVEPGSGEILVRTHAVAVNPVDWMLLYFGNLFFRWVKKPFILGSDLAGQVVAVGPGVNTVRVGDRVLALAAGSSKQRNRAAEGAFQAYTIVLPELTARLPDSLSYAEAAVIPLGLAAAACGLFQNDLLALTLPATIVPSRNQWVIVTGGATSVGCNAIQLAAAAGYCVVTTASPKNFAYLKALGAAHVFDYTSRSVVHELTAVLQGKHVVGALAIASGSAADCIEVLARCRGRRFVANCSSPIPLRFFATGKRPTTATLLSILPRVLASMLRLWWKSHRHGIVSKFYDASSMIENEVGRYIFQDYLGKALADGSFCAAPSPQVVGAGLESIQTGFDVQRRGVSAAKVVISLADGSQEVYGEHSS